MNSCKNPFRRDPWTPFSQILLLDCELLRDPAAYAAALGRMDDARREKIERCDTEEDKRLRLGVGLLGELLLRKHGLTGKLRFAADGKPVLPEGEYISFSHGGRYAAAGISPAPIGVDLEALCELDPAIARHFYTPEEKRYVTGADDPDAAFWRLWCRKECLVKRDGLRDPREIPVLGDPPDGRFWEYPLPGHICVCLTAPGIEPVFRVCSIEELLG